MRIELNAGGLGGAITVAAFALSYDKMLNNARAVAASFKTVKKMTSQANGGVGKLQTAVDSIEARIKAEQKKIDKIVTTQKKLGDFIVHTIKTDTKVAVMVAVNREMFYLVNPWARPSLANFIKKVIKIVGSTMKKMWHSVVNFFKKYGKQVIKLAVPLLIELGLAVVTYFVPELAPVTTKLMKDIAVNTLKNIVVESIKEGYKYYKENGTLKGSFDRIFDAAANGAVKGSIETLTKGLNISHGGAIADFVIAVIDGRGFEQLKQNFFNDINSLFKKTIEHIIPNVPIGGVIDKLGGFTGIVSGIVSVFKGENGSSVVDVVKGKITEIISRFTAYQNVKCVTDSNVIGIKTGEVWNGFKAMNVDFTHNFKEFVAQKFDLPVLPGGVAQVDDLNAKLHSAASGGNNTGSSGGNSGGGINIKPLRPWKPNPMPTPVRPHFPLPRPGPSIIDIIRPHPIPVPPPPPPIDIRDIIRPVHIVININIIFKAGSRGAVIA